MKTTALMRYAAVAFLTAAPLFAYAQDIGAVQRCMDKFATENFSDRAVSFKAESAEAPVLPLSLNNGTQRVLVVASDAVSGHVIAKASCSVRRDEARLTDIVFATVIAQR